MIVVKSKYGMAAKAASIQLTLEDLKHIMLLHSWNTDHQNIQYILSINPSDLQGDTSGCDEPPVDFNTTVLIWPGLARQKRNFCFEVNGRFVTT